MTNNVLESLKGEEFYLSVGFIQPPALFRRVLQRSPHVRHLAVALAQGSVTEPMIRRFAASLTEQFTPGSRLPHDLALAALAVILENRPTHFAEEYLHDLGRLRLAEMSLGIQIARECLANRGVVDHLLG